LSAWCDGVGNDPDSVLPFFSNTVGLPFFSLLVCCFGCFELSRENAKMVEIHREKRKREATKIINTENGRREKKRSALLSQ
jgi:hypothetical protein